MRLFIADPSCTSCPLHEEAKSVGIPSLHLPESLPPKSQAPAILMVGQNPGWQENNVGEPFVGPSGELLRNTYCRGFDLHLRTSIYLSNAARCWSPVEPKKTQYDACFKDHMLPDILNIWRTRPVQLLVLCLGAHAVRTCWEHILGAKKISLRHAFANQATAARLDYASRHPDERTRDAISAQVDLTLFATYHPAAILRTQRLIYPVNDHISLLSRFLQGALPQATQPTIVAPRSPNK